MSKWIYDGYTKVHDDSRKHMIEKWCYHCSDCGFIIRIEPKQNIFLICPNCGGKVNND